MIANPRRLIHFQLEVWEAELAKRLEGELTVGELILEHLEGTGDLDAGAVTDLVTFLRREGFLDPLTADVPAALAEALRPRPSVTDHVVAFAKTLRLDWLGADRHVRWWYRSLLHPLFSRIGVVVTAVIALGGFVAFLVVNAQGRYSIGESNAPLDSLILLALGFVLTYAHEIGHAIALVHYRRRIKSAGFMLYFGSPAFFVDASDGLMLDRVPRIVESALGPYTEMILAGIGSFLLLVFPDASFSPLLFTFCALNYFLIFENLIPLLELDGYFILAEAIEVPDLRERSLQFIEHDVWHKLRTRAGFSKQEIGLGVYAVVGVLFTIFSVWVAIFFWEAIFGGLVSGLWNGGTGSRLLLLLLALFLAGPAIRGFDHPRPNDAQTGPSARAEGQIPIRDLMACRGRRVDRCPSCVRRAPGRRPVRSGGPGAPRRVPAGRTGLPTGRPPYRLLRRAEGHVADRGRAPRDR